MKDLNWKGIVLALVIKKFSSYLAGLMLSFWGAFKIRSLGLSPHDTANYVNHVPEVYYWSIVISLTISALCGYIAAGTNRRYAVVNAVIMGLLSFILSVATSKDSFRITPAWFQNLAPVVVLFGAFLGGYIRSRRPFKTSPILETPQSPLPDIPHK